MTRDDSIVPRSIEVDISRFPLVITTLRGSLRMDDVLEMQRVFEQLFADRRPFATISDARALDALPTAAIRRAIATWNVAHEMETATYDIAATAVFESALTRAAFRVLHWVAPHPSPFVVVATLDEALEFALGALRDAGVAVPSTVDVRSILGG